MNCRLEKVRIEEKDEFWIYLQNYLGFLSQYDPFVRKNEFGFYPYWTFTTFLTDKNRTAFWFIKDNKKVGFVFVILNNEFNALELVDFFICEEFRGQGLGKTFAKMLLQKLKGEWYVYVLRNNLRAVSFWDKILSVQKTPTIENGKVMYRYICNSK